MILNDREIKILKEFYYNKEVKLETLSKMFNVSERMIRYNIDRINVVLEFLKISPIHKVSKGLLKLNVEKNNDKILEIITKLEPLDKNRKIILINFLIVFSKNKITISYLSNYFNISRATVGNYLNDISKELKKKNLYISNDDGLAIKGNVEDIEKYKQYLLTENIDIIEKDEYTEISLKIKEIIFENIEKKILKKLKNFVADVINDFNLNITDAHFKSFYSKLLYIFYIENLESDTVLYKKEYEYTREKLLRSNISNAKIIEISNLIFNIKNYEKYLLEKDEIDKLNVEILAKNIIENVAIKTKINIRKDNLLFEFLSQHLQVLMRRIKNGYKLEVPLDDIDKKEDNIYKYIKDAVVIINDIVGSKLPDDEIHLIKMHFLASIERINKLESKPVELIIVSSFGRGSNKILVDNIQNKFYVRVVDIVPLYKLKNSLKKSSYIKYILTTVDIDEKEYKDKIIIKISPIISEKDKVKLQELGFKTNTNRIKLSNILEIIRRNTDNIREDKLIEELLSNYGDKLINDINIDYYKEILKVENILFDYNAKSIEDAIEKSCTILEGEYIDKSYTEEVLSIFKNKNSHIIRYNGIILPHTKNRSNVYKNGVAIVKLKEAVIIEKTNEKIDTIVTFVIEDAKKSLDTISRIINLIFKEKFRKVLEKQDKEEVIKYLKI